MYVIKSQELTNKSVEQLHCILKNVRLERCLNVVPHNTLSSYLYQQMDNPCGQCFKPFSPACQTLVPCTVHQAQCFQCQLCPENAHLPVQTKNCSICNRISPIQDLYYDYQCDKHICRFHFLKMDYALGEITLPCGDKQQASEILMFMSSYCILCGRKLSNKRDLQLGICIPCEKIGFAAASKSKEVRLDNKSQQILHIQAKKTQERERVQNDSKELTREITQLKSQLMLLQQSFKVSEFTRQEIKKAIYHTERDKECLICLEPYNLTNKKPMMVCLQQHLVCEKCLSEQVTLLNCPLCRDEIVRSKIMPSRERIKTMQLELIISERYQTKLQKCLLLQQQQIIAQKSPKIDNPAQPKDVKVVQPKREQPLSIEHEPKSYQSSISQSSSKKVGIPRKVPVARKVVPPIPSLTQAKRGRQPSLKHNGQKKNKK